MTAHAMQPTVGVDDPTDTSWDTPPLDPLTYCTRFLDEPNRQYTERMAAEKAECDACTKTTGSAGDMPCIENGSCNADPPGPPSCSLAVTTKVAAGAWLGAGTVRTSTDSQWSAIFTQLVVATREGVWPIGEVYDCGHFSDTPRCEVAVTAVKVLAGGALTVTATYTEGSTTTKLAYLCTPSRGEVSCDAK